MKTSKLILVVEDSTTQAEYLRRILEGEGYRVDTVSDGDSALARISLETPDLVLSDIVMPGMSGFELCEKIKATFDIPVFLVTQLYDPEDVVHGVASGADNFIIKPFDPDFILDRIREFFQTAGTPEETGDLSITISERRYKIDADRETILQILLSTYALAVRKNTDLQEARDELFALNEQLQQKNDDLKTEIHERERVERALSEAHKKLSLVTSITRHGLLNQLESIDESLEYAERVLRDDAKNAREILHTSRTSLKRAIQTTRFTQEYQKIGESAPVWENLAGCVPGAGDYPLQREVDVPGDVRIYLDPSGRDAIRAVFADAVRRNAEEVTVRFVEMKGGATIIIEDDGIGIPKPSKEALFSYEQSPARGFSLFLAREALAITGIGLNETGDPRQGARFEIQCPDEVIRRSTR
ncbi:MAG: response regulator [Methanocalculus sp. MSAO_Arc1]|uniref:response regulator n=1 Tax=Methanocalculus TaxID=71151 RepID=UPI000FED858F|nr:MULTISPECIES: response regulator [unclassified Methanocalculus]MCP1661559.1 DNA-binding response OmpR family regulator [Methanocalculus sp. AMF5]RQD80913.1 MAG: response regulator [Methanocalculus sp. MSAO_Arc1]